MAVLLTLRGVRGTGLRRWTTSAWRWTAQFTRELLELLWALEATVERQPALAELLEAVVAGACLGADELPGPAAWEREALKERRRVGRHGAYAQVKLE